MKIIYHILLVSITLSTTFLTYSQSYLLPLGELEQDSLLLSYITVNAEKSEVRLYAWDQKTGRMTPLLSSMYHPFFAQPLPQHSAFSFLDEGRLRIKEINKRSPKTIVLSDKQLIESAMYSWIDNQNCIVCAWRYYPSTTVTGTIVSKQGTYGLYRMQLSDTTETSITSIVTSPFYDFVCPAICQDYLFYIHHATQEISCAVFRTQYTDHQEQELILENTDGAEFDMLIPLAPDDVICFLLLNYTYYAIRCIKQDSVWEYQELFRFHARSIGYQDPFHFFTPIVIDNELVVYFDMYDLKRYNLRTGEIDSIAQGDETFMLCSPCYVKGTLYCGCSIDKKNTCMWTKNHTTLYCKLPTFTFKAMLPEATLPTSELNYMHYEEADAVNDCEALAEQA